MKDTEKDNNECIQNESIQNSDDEFNESSNYAESESKADGTFIESSSEFSEVSPTESADNTDNKTDECIQCNQSETSSEELSCQNDADPEPLASHIDEVFNKLDEKIDALNKQFSDRIARSEYEAKIIQNMDSELKTYKDDLYRSILKPLILELIDLRESILKMSAFYLKKPEGEQTIPNATFADYAEDISDILEKYDVEVIKSISGDDCISGKHKILKTVPTDKESLHKKIAESLSSGYMYNGRVIFAERVNVYKFEESVPAAAENVTDTNASENAEVSESTENTENTEKSETTERLTSEQNSDEKEDL